MTDPLSAEQRTRLEKIRPTESLKPRLAGKAIVEWLDFLALMETLKQAERELDTYKTLAKVGPWHNDCRPNRYMAARELAKSQAIIDKLADTITALHAEQARLRAALERILAWKMPPTGKFHEDGSPQSYEWCFGSLGERQVIQQIAREALAGAPEETGAVKVCECGAPLTVCVSCAVGDWQAAHPACPHCCPAEPPKEETTAKLQYPKLVPVETLGCGCIYDSLRVLAVRCRDHAAEPTKEPR